jgi:hypothetical protein
MVDRAEVGDFLAELAQEILIVDVVTIVGDIGLLAQYDFFSLTGGSREHAPVNVGAVFEIGTLGLFRGDFKDLVDHLF